MWEPFSDDYKPLYPNDGKAMYSEISPEMGIAWITSPFVTWATGFLDFPFVQVQVVGRGVVGHQQIRLAVVIDVDENAGASIVGLSSATPACLLTSVKAPSGLL
jgi:hypothetical protein